LQSFTFVVDRQANYLQITREPMPYGRVLVVDDVNTNLFVAEGLLVPYKLNVETASSGFAAIEKVTSGKEYDIIFMDHMMPQMDGLETTQKLRVSGYTGTIVALTANALTGNDIMFMQNGFDGFISKPIDVRVLNRTLNKFIRDKYPDEAKKYKYEIAGINETPVISPKMLQLFCIDAKESVAVMRTAIENGDIKLFTTNAHAMKSVLANIAEYELSEMAYVLERAGLSGDTDYIKANTAGFIEILEALITKYSPSQATAVNTADVTEDTEYLAEQLQIIKKACEDYNDDAVYAAIDRLKEKQWNLETSAKIEKIRDVLFLSSDFDEAIKQCDRLISDMKDVL